MFFIDGIELILMSKVNTILGKSMLNITLFRLTYRLKSTVFHFLKAGEVIVTSGPHFCVLGTSLYGPLS